MRTKKVLYESELGEDSLSTFGRRCPGRFRAAFFVGRSEKGNGGAKGDARKVKDAPHVPGARDEMDRSCRVKEVLAGEK